MQIQVKLEDETVWLTQGQMATLFNKGRSAITEHISNIFKEKELEGKREVNREIEYYNLDVITSVGYRVKSPLIAARANNIKFLMGLSNFKGSYLTKQDIGVAKNYLNEGELNQLNLIVTLYLDFVELQAMNGRFMNMRDWIQKLDDFLKLSEKKVLINAGKTSHEQALKKAQVEFEKYKQSEDKKRVSDFDKAAKKILKIKKR